MPNYTYKCKSCNTHFLEFFSVSERDTPLTEPCPECGALQVVQTIEAINLGDSVRMGMKKIDGGFTEVLQKMEEKHKYDKHARVKGKFYN